PTPFKSRSTTRLAVIRCLPRRAGRRCSIGPLGRVVPRALPLPGDPHPMPDSKKRVTLGSAWREAQALIAEHRKNLAIGLGLMLVSRLAGLALPVSTKWLIDDVIGKRQPDLLLPLALVVGSATLIQALASFALS